MSKPKQHPETKKEENVIIKTEHQRVLIKFKPEELEEKTTQLQGLLMEKFKSENLIETCKISIKDFDQKLKKVQEELTLGGIKTYEECEVRIYRDIMKKHFYFEGVLVDEEDAYEDDFQLEIEEEETEEENN